MAYNRHTGIRIIKNISKLKRNVNYLILIIKNVVVDSPQIPFDQFLILSLKLSEVTISTVLYSVFENCHFYSQKHSTAFH